MRWSEKIAVRSHDPGFLWRVAAGIVAAGAALSLVTPLLPIGGDDPVRLCLLALAADPADPWAAVRHVVQDDAHDYYAVLHAVGAVAEETDSLPPASLMEHAPGAWTEQQRLVAEQLVASLTLGRPTDELVALADAAPPQPYANFAVALTRLATHDLTAATAALRAEGEQPNAAYAREMLLDELTAADRWATLAELVEQPEYAAIAPGYVLARLAAERGDWLTVLRYCPRTLVDRFQWGPAVLALLTGACWLAFLLHAGRAGSGGVSWPLCVTAVALGVASIPLTHFFIYVQEDGWGLKESSQLLPGLKFYILGVGLREELAKLLLLLPLVPVLVRRRSELEALFVSACVGLGFAIAENVGYFGGSLGASSIGRLTTANFLHMSLTGLVGLAVCRACWHPKTLGPEAAAVFCVAAILHGLYDAFLALPALSTELNIVAMIIYVAVVYQFFREFRAANGDRSYRLSVSFTFTVGVALVASATFVYLSSQLGQTVALKVLAGELIANAATIYLFLREAPDSLIDR